MRKIHAQEPRNPVIAVDGYPGSGSEEAARALAERLGLPCYGRDEQLDEASRLSGIERRVLDKYAERNMYAAYDLAAEDCDKLRLPSAIRLVRAKLLAIVSLARGGPCVFAGGHASVALPPEYGAVRIFVCADGAGRAKTLGSTERELARADKRLQSYYRQFNRAWGAPPFYDLDADAAYLGGEDAMARIAELFTKEAKEAGAS
ncbi:MAG: cytidylate kinase-like family protein [Oscillospiraceae bacterium]|nr:cytidylate kinase-like family protein [Oscillospiraceae bacterium]